jgi:hypothetical protein
LLEACKPLSAKNFISADAEKFCAIWTGKMTDEYLDTVLAELTTAIERHREALSKRVN